MELLLLTVSLGEGPEDRPLGFYCWLGLAPQERKYCLRRGVGLSHRGDGGLLQDLRLGEVGRFGRDIGVADLGFGGGETRDLGLRQADGVVQLVLAGTDSALNQAELFDGG